MAGAKVSSSSSPTENKRLRGPATPSTTPRTLRVADAASKKSCSPTFKGAAQGLAIGKRISNGLLGPLRGRLLLNAELPPDLEMRVAEQMNWALIDEDLQSVSQPEEEDRNSLDKSVDDESMALTDSPVRIAVCDPAPTDKEDAGSADTATSEADSIEECIQAALETFTYRMESVPDAQLDEMTSGIITGLKSWLSFGSSVAPTSAASSTALEVDSRMATIIATTQAAVDNRREGGVSTASADDRLTKLAEEQAKKIAGDFCNWLRDLPEGEDDTVNTLPEDHIRALFDTAQAANPAKSKLAEGLKSWAKFGAQVTGRSDEIVSIAKNQMSKNRFRKQTETLKRQRHGTPRGTPRKAIDLKTLDRHKAFIVQASPTSFDSGCLQEASARQQRRAQYAGGTWYLSPDKWSDRFFTAAREAQLQQEDCVEATLASTLPASERPPASSMLQRGGAGVGEILSGSGEIPAAAASGIPQLDKKRIEAGQREAENRRIGNLQSAKAFSTFLAKRQNYNVPEFLRLVLEEDSSPNKQQQQQHSSSTNQS